MRVIGMISGTSVDAIDVAAAEFGFRDGAITMRPLGFAERAWDPALRERILATLPPGQTTMGEVCRLDIGIGEAFAAEAAWGIAHLAGGRADLVASHGQNLFHWVEGGRARATLQLGQPAAIAERTGLPVLSDLRAADVAAGGQGAPLASTLDALWLASTDGSKRAALNLGGIANITVVGRFGEPVQAFDTGPANCLMDIAIARHSGGAQGSDIDGRVAAGGRVREDLLARLLTEPYYALPPPKSTGRELFDVGHVAPHAAGLPEISAPDLLRTLAELSAATVADACRGAGVVEVVASGGGVRNPVLMDALRQRLGPIALTTAEARGLPSAGKEAYLFALLGFLSWNGLPGIVPGATGSHTPRILGRLSAGHRPLRLPDPAATPNRLLIEPAP